MAFTSTIIRENGDSITTAHCVLGSFAELQKGVLVLRVLIWATKQDYLKSSPAAENLRFVVSADAVASDINIRTGIYTWLMQQPEFVNAVADMDDDFPVTPIE